MPGCRSTFNLGIDFLRENCSIKKGKFQICPSNFRYLQIYPAIFHNFKFAHNLPIPSTENPPQVATTTKAQTGYGLELGGGVREGLGRVRKVRVRKFGLVGKS